LSVGATASCNTHGSQSPQGYSGWTPVARTTTRWLELQPLVHDSVWGATTFLKNFVDIVGQ